MLQTILSMFRKNQPLILTDDDITDSAAHIVASIKKRVSLVSDQQASWSAGLPKDKNDENFNDAYKGVLWVNASVRAVIEPAKDIPIKIYRAQDIYSGENLSKLKEVKRGLAYELLQEPNPMFSFCEWQEYMLGSILLSGNMYSVYDKENRELWPLRPANVLIKAARMDFIDKYVVKDSDNQEAEFVDPIFVIHGKMFNPGKKGWFYGLSPLEAAWDAVNYQDKEARFNEIFWKEGARLQGAYFVKDTLSADQIKQLENAIQKRNKGVKNMLKDIIVQGGMDYKQLGVSASDQKIIERLQMTTEEVLAAYRVPPGIVGVLEHSNYSNMEVQERLLWKNAIVPVLGRLTEALNKNPLLSENGSLVFIHDTSHIAALQDNLKEKAELGIKLIENGWTQNEVRKDLWDKEPHPDGDEIKAIIGSRSQTPLITLGSVPRETKSEELPEPPKQIEAPKFITDWTLSHDSARAVAKEFEDELDQEDGTFTPMVKAHFKRQNDLVQKNIRIILRDKGGEPSIEDFKKMLTGMENEAQSFKNELKAPMTHVIQKFGKRAHDRLKQSLKSVNSRTVKGDEERRRVGRLLTPQFDFNDPGVQKYLLDRPIAITGIIDGKTVEDLRVSIAEAIKEGGSYADVADVVSTYFDSIERYRALRIARTETASAANFATEKTYSQNSDVVWGKRWITAQDDLVRDTHREDSVQPNLNGEPIAKMDEDFNLKSGASGPRPQAFGEPGEDINCRCTISPVTMFDALERGLITQDEFDALVGEE